MPERADVIIATVMVDGWNQRRAQTARRLTELGEAVVLAKGFSAELLCLPGGYFYASSKAKFERLRFALAELAKRRRVSLAVGVDLGPKFEKGKSWVSDERVKEGRLPLFAIIVDNTGRSKVIRQSSTSSRDFRYSPGSLIRQSRTLSVGDRKIAILLCGEVFSRKLQNSLAADNVDAVVNLAHFAQGFRVARTLAGYARDGIAAFSCAHAGTSTPMHHGYMPTHGRVWRLSVREPDIALGTEPVLRIKRWVLRSS